MTQNHPPHTDCQDFDSDASLVASGGWCAPAETMTQTGNGVVPLAGSGDDPPMLAGERVRVTRLDDRGRPVAVPGDPAVLPPPPEPVEDSLARQLADLMPEMPGFPQPVRTDPRVWQGPNIKLEIDWHGVNAPAYATSKVTYYNTFDRVENTRAWTIGAGEASQVAADAMAKATEWAERMRRTLDDPEDAA